MTASETILVFQALQRFQRDQCRHSQECLSWDLSDVSVVITDPGVVDLRGGELEEHRGENALLILKYKDHAVNTMISTDELAG